MDSVIFIQSTWLLPIFASEFAVNFIILPWQKKKEPSWWCIMEYRRICGLISLRCIDAWSRKSHSPAVPQLNQSPWFLNITRFCFYASTAWFFFLSMVVVITIRKTHVLTVRHWQLIYEPSPTNIKSSTSASTYLSNYQLSRFQNIRLYMNIEMNPTC